VNLSSGTDPAQARAAALKSVSGNEFEDALAKWAKNVK